MTVTDPIKQRLRAVMDIAEHAPEEYQDECAKCLMRDTLAVIECLEADVRREREQRALDASDYEAKLRASRAALDVMTDEVLRASFKKAAL